MSMLLCDNCGEIFDTDDYPQGYIESLDEWLCEKCDETRDDYIATIEWARERARVGKENPEPKPGAS